MRVRKSMSTKCVHLLISYNFSFFLGSDAFQKSFYDLDGLYGFQVQFALLW